MTGATTRTTVYEPNPIPASEVDAWARITRLPENSLPKFWEGISALDSAYVEWFRSGGKVT